MKPKVNIMWFRRDLRLTDNAALYHALKSDRPVLPIFIFDRNILDGLETRSDRRVACIHAALEEMEALLQKKDSGLQVFYGFPEQVYKELLERYDIEKVFTNHDYEPYAQERDQAIEKLLRTHHATVHTFKDQVIFEKGEVMKDDGTPYTVFTPYANKWKAKLKPFYYQAYPTEKYSSNFYKQQA